MLGAEGKGVCRCTGGQGNLSLRSLWSQSLLLPIPYSPMSRPTILHVPHTQCRNVLATRPHTSMPTGGWAEGGPHYRLCAEVAVWGGGYGRRLD